MKRKVPIGLNGFFVFALVIMIFFTGFCLQLILWLNGAPPPLIRDNVLSAQDFLWKGKWDVVLLKSQPREAYGCRKFF